MITVEIVRQIIIFDNHPVEEIEHCVKICREGGNGLMSIFCKYT